MNLKKDFDYKNFILEMGQRGAFLVSSSKTLGKSNIMTLGWGNYGYFWKKEVLLVPVRKSRFTHSILKQQDGKEFTICLPEEHCFAKEIAVCGTKSARDIDKTKELDLALLPARKANAYIVDGCKSYIECKILASASFDTELMDEATLNQWYAKNSGQNKNEIDLHELFFCEILACY